MRRYSSHTQPRPASPRSVHLVRVTSSLVMFLSQAAQGPQIFTKLPCLTPALSRKKWVGHLDMIMRATSGALTTLRIGIVML